MDHVIVVDYGSQYTRLITRRLRELGAYSLIVTPEELSAALGDSPAAVVLSGGPASVHGGPVPSLPRELLEGDTAVLGICYGMQLLTRALGGEVEPGSVREYGKAVLSQCDGQLFDGLEGEFVAWMSHGDSVKRPPAGFTVTASSEDTPVAAMESEDGRLFGLQFHPEVLHTPKGMEVLERFLDSSRAGRDWTPEHVVDTLIAEVQERVGDERVLLAVSGGVDSSTLGLLLNRALGDKLHAVFVDHGLLRMSEAEEVERALRSLGVNLKTVDASDQFISDLEGVSDPEEKRKIIGRDFIDVFTAEAKQLQAEYGEIRFLAQGTLYPDVIESAGGHGAANIKSHHNVGGLPEKLGFELLEPFRTLFKDEVREVAAMLGMPPALRERHPFPGPGLAIRCLGPVSRERLEVLRRVDDIFIGALREFGLYDSAWQALAILTPIRSVGVMGDGRTYANTVALRAVSSVDGMTADWTRFPDEFLATISNRIVNRVAEVNRVVYDITSKPPGTIEWE